MVGSDPVKRGPRHDHPQRLGLAAASLRKIRRCDRGRVAVKDGSRRLRSQPPRHADLDDFAALDPFFRIIEQGLDGLAGPGHFFDLVAEDAVFEYVITVPGYPRRVEGRAAVAELYRPYGDALVLDRCYDLAVHHDPAQGTVVLEYASAGKVVATGAPTATATSPSSPSATARSSTGGTTSTRSPSSTHSAGRLAELVKHRPVRVFKRFLSRTGRW
jgi:hypothetical protein